MYPGRDEQQAFQMKDVTHVLPRYMDVSSMESAARKGGLGDRVTLASFVTCLLLRSEQTISDLRKIPAASSPGYSFVRDNQWKEALPTTMLSTGSTV